MAVLGAEGQLGTALQEVLGNRAIPFSHDELDVTGAGLVMGLNECKPDWIINCAAVHKVDDLEKNPTYALSVNAIGAYNVAVAARNIGAGVVYISTDYVFGHNGPFWEGDIRYSLNVYGISKVAGENFTKAYAPAWIIVRTCSLFGSASSKGANFVETMLRLGKERDTLEVVSDIVMSPTYTKDLAAKIVELLEKRKASSTVHITNAGRCTYKEFAEEIFRRAEMNVEVKPCFSADRDIAKRPRLAVLMRGSLSGWGMDDMRTWQDALSEYLQEKL